MSFIDVEQMYGDWPLSDEEVQEILDRSLGPRSSDSLFTTVASLGVGPEHRVLDAGARDARHALTLAGCFGCHVVAVDPVARHIEEANKAIANDEHGDLVEVRQGRLEDLPIDDGSVELVFCRDVLSHISDLATALSECRRVLVPGGHMVIYQTFATDRMEPKEAAFLYPSLAVVPESMDPSRLETEAAQAGLTVASTDVIGSEWREAWEEDGTRRTADQLLQAARLFRGRDHLLEELGDTMYRVELANAIWGVYQMIGKLEPRVYVLRKD